MIDKPPNFDQILSVKLIGRQPTITELNRGIKILVEGRGNTPLERLKPGQQPQRARAEFMLPTRALPFDVQVQPDVEYYFEEGELAMPPTFEQTEEERRSSF
jgi:hypothetical protein